MAERAFVISDTHLGAGKEDPLEDFDQDDAFVAFISKVARSDTTLFVNGDFVDFAQIPPFEVPKPRHLLWEEAASIVKLEAVLKAHASCFAAMKAFIAAGGRLRILIGNHDFDFGWPRVQERVRRALGAPAADRLGFTVGPEMFCGIHIEHGHAFTPENSPRDPERLFHDFEQRRYLERVWGTDFMLQFYNELEREHPYADNVKPMLSVLWHGLKKRWIGGRELLRLLVFLKKRGIPWSGMTSALLDEPETVEPHMVASSFAEPDWQQMIAERADDDAAFVEELGTAASELEPTERRIVAAPEQVELAIDPTLGAALETPKVMGLFRDDREHRAAVDRLKRSGATGVVFGHTHQFVDGNELEGTLKGQLFNPGTWLPNLDLTSEHVRQKIKEHGLTKTMLKDSSLYRVERWTVQIDSNVGYAARVQMVACDDI